MKRLWKDGEILTARKISNSIVDFSSKQPRSYTVITDTDLMGTSGFNVKSVSDDVSKLIGWQGITFPVTETVVSQWNDDNFPYIFCGLGILSKIDINLSLYVSFRDSQNKELDKSELKILRIKANQLLTVNTKYFKVKTSVPYTRITLTIADPGVHVLDFSVFGLYFDLIGVNE